MNGVCVSESEFFCSNPVSSDEIVPETNHLKFDAPLDISFYPTTNDSKYKVVVDTMLCIICPKYQELLAASKPEFLAKVEKSEGEVPRSVAYTYFGERVTFNKFTVL